MKNAYFKFESLIEDTKQVQIIYEYMKKMSAPLDIDDLLRWQWIQVVSALDKLVHDIVKIGMIEEFNGVREKTNQFNNFSIDMNDFFDMNINPVTSVNYFEKRVNKLNGYKSFQDPKKISEALSFIWSEKHKWKEIANMLNMSEKDCVTLLNNIVIRRNQIAHEGDYIDDYSKRQDILEADVMEVKTFILKLGRAIYDLVKL